MIKWLSKGIMMLSLLLMLVIIPSSGFSESFWEGSIITANYGELPQEGFYGASNAFPINTVIIVTNSNNGKSVVVTIRKRLDNGHAFLALSKDAGAKIGLSGDTVINGTISIKPTQSGNTGNSTDLIQNRDPDINPSDNGKKNELDVILNYIDTELGGENPGILKSSGEDGPDKKNPENSKKIVIPQETVDSLQEKELSGKKASELSVPVRETPASMIIKEGSPVKIVLKSTSLPDPLIMKNAMQENEKPEVYSSLNPGPEITGRKIFRADSLPKLTSGETDTPQVLSMIAYADKKHFTPPVLALPDVVSSVKSSTENIPTVITAETPFVKNESIQNISPVLPEIIAEKKPAVTVKSIEPSPVPSGKTVTMKNAPVPVPNRNPVSGKSENIKIILEPAKPKPPVPVQKEILKTESIISSKQSEKATVAEAVNNHVNEANTPEAAYTLVPSLKKGAYYLQLGSYAEEYSAKDLADVLLKHYPVTVLVGKKNDTSSYKVMVGPLNQDEGGSLLFNFRARGYKDAFLRKGL